LRNHRLFIDKPFAVSPLGLSSFDEASVGYVANGLAASRHLRKIIALNYPLRFNPLFFLPTTLL
jgi:hypothetical protein